VLFNDQGEGAVPTARVPGLFAEGRNTRRAPLGVQITAGDQSAVDRILSSQV
jgi:hypothetical protein